MFMLLGTRKEENESMDLVRWDRVEMPKKLGGWGLKNIFEFIKTLSY